MAEENAMRQSITMNDLASKEYISLKVGESAEITIERIDKVKVDPENIKITPLSKTDFRYEIFTEDNKCLTVSSWKLWGAIRKALQDAGIIDIRGTNMSIIHVGTGEYSAKVIV